MIGHYVFLGTYLSLFIYRVNLLHMFYLLPCFTFFFFILITIYYAILYILLKKIICYQTPSLQVKLYKGKFFVCSYMFCSLL